MTSLIFTNLSFNIFSLTKKKVGFNLAGITLRQLSLIIRSITLLKKRFWKTHVFRFP